MPRQIERMDVARKDDPTGHQWTGRIAPARLKPRHRSYAGAGCPVEAALERIDGKWKGVLLYHLLIDGPLRFNALARRCAGATPRVVTRQLRELALDGLVSRTVHPTVPPQVEYALTPEGRTLGPVLLALRDWGRRVLGR